MEYNNIAYWYLGSQESTRMHKLYINAATYNVDKLSVIIGCNLYDNTRNALNVEHIDDIGWYGTIVDRKKHLLAKIKYGI